MLMIVFGAGCLLLSVLFHAASLLHLSLPLLYALIVPTLFSGWYYSHYARQEPSVRIFLYFNYNMFIFQTKKFRIYGRFSIMSIAFLPSLGHGLGQAKITPRPA